MQLHSDVNSHQRLLKQLGIDVISLRKDFDSDVASLLQKLRRDVYSLHVDVGSPRGDIDSFHDDVDSLQKELEVNVGSLREEFDTGIDSMRDDLGSLGKELRGVLGSLCEDLRSDVDSLRGDVDSFSQELRGGVDSLGKDLRSDHVLLREELRDDIDSLRKFRRHVDAFQEEIFSDIYSLRSDVHTYVGSLRSGADFLEEKLHSTASSLENIRREVQTMESFSYSLHDDINTVTQSLQATQNVLSEPMVSVHLVNLTAPIKPPLSGVPATMPGLEITVTLDEESLILVQYRCLSHGPWTLDTYLVVDGHHSTTFANLHGGCIGHSSTFTDVISAGEHSFAVSYRAGDWSSRLGEVTARVLKVTVIKKRFNINPL